MIDRLPRDAWVAVFLVGRVYRVGKYLKIPTWTTNGGYDLNPMNLQQLLGCENYASCESMSVLFEMS